MKKIYKDLLEGMQKDLEAERAKNAKEEL